MQNQKEIEILIRLAKIKGLGEVGLKKLILHFDSVFHIIDAPKYEIASIVGEKLANKIKNLDRKGELPEINVLNKIGAKIITIKEYPENLKNLSDAPPFLYIKGEIIPEDKNAIAVVGTRNPSYYGRGVAEKFAKDFASAGLTIVSGFARGIDTIVHKIAIETNGRTIAVFGSGIDIIYPPENRKLAEDISNNGAYISEFALGTQPWWNNFLYRNRLIAGLSMAVVAIEAGERSGVLSTARWAAEQGKEIFAVPGNITSEKSKGTNQLIMMGAQITTSPYDVMDYLGIPINRDKKEVKLNEEEQKIFNLLSNEPIHIDKLAENANIGVAKTLSILLNLEIQGIIKQLPGKNFIKAL